MNRRRGILKILLVALVFAMWAFVSVGCVHGIAAPEEEWNRTFGGYYAEGATSVQQTMDGGYILLGTTQSYGAGFGIMHFWLVKTNANGIEQWNRTFGGLYGDYGHSVQQTTDGGYVMAGYTYPYSDAQNVAWLVKTDSNGTEQWNRTFGGTYGEDAHVVQQTSDGGYILIGGTNTYGVGGDFWLVKTDAYGIESWNKSFGRPGFYPGESASSGQQTPDGGYILGGTTITGYPSLQMDGWLVKTDANGNKQWDRIIGGASVSQVQQTSDGGYILFGTTSSYRADLRDAWLVKTDANGNQQWNRTFGGPSYDTARSGQQTSDGGYILLGTTVYSNYEYPWLVKTDSNGTEQWNRTFGGVGFDVRAVQQTSDEGYIIAGGIAGDIGSDFWLIKFRPPQAENKPPTAIIDSITPNPAKQGEDTVSFIGHGNDSDGSVVAYNWTSSIDGLLNTSPLFTKPASELSVGLQIIYFSVQDEDGAWSSADTEILTIEAANQPPVASFTYSPVNPGINETVTFNASTSYDPDGTIVSYTWIFGDENSTNTTELCVTHSYASVGNYTVNLTLTDDEGATNTTSRALQVSLKPPIAMFSCSPMNPVINETVTFNATESYDPNGVVTKYEFEFGDGANGTGEVVIHSYSAVGTYTVNLTLTDNEGATNRTSQTIKVFSNITYFDTEPGTYPSLSGTYNGTLTMTHSVNVNTIYIYPCVGSGGHIEYAKIWNTLWDGAEVHWNGYVDEWHNLPFEKNFTLVAGETYNYTIQTGSYPQIHHTPELLTAKGWITCEEFVDINGKRHEGWIPAIRLE
jgi:PKD repeat protein